MEIRVLGPMEVWEGSRLLDVGPRMPRAVLALLVMDANRVVSLDRLIDQLWGDTPPATATTALQGYVSQLRRVLEPGRAPRTPPQVLVTQPPGYLLRIDPERLDAARFEVLVDEGHQLLASGRPGAAREVLRRALALWRSTPYAEFAFDPFASTEVARLGELRAIADETLAAANLAVGEHGGTVAELERLVTADPLRERRWELLALALYRSGRQAEALRALDRARRTLAEELGIEPGQTLRQLEQDILDQSPALEWRPPEAVPQVVPVAVTAGATAATAATAAPARAAATVATTAATTVAPAPSRRPLVGREQELDQLLLALDSVCHGHGRLALIAGEAGIGKTRLVEELSDRAAGRNVQVAWGRCYEGETAPAYWPWTQIIRTLVEERAPASVLAALAGGVPELAQIVPEIKELLGGEVEPLQLVEPEAARSRLYGAIVGFVLRLAADQPLVLVVDDLHWSDIPSLQLVRLLAAQLSEAAVLLVCTYRDTDAGVAEPDGADTGADNVVSVLAHLARVPGVVRIRPRGLSEAGVAELVAAASGTAPPAGVAEAIHARTDGNPFFVSELARLLGSQRQLDAAADVARREIPAGVRDVIRLRLARLPDEAVALLGVAAVIGREFDLDLLIAAADLDDEQALELVEAALLTGVVVEDAAVVGRYRFSHALVRETVYDGLSGVRRPRLHRRVAAALQGLGDADDAHVFEIAQHLFAAAPLGAADEAYEWALKAAARAMTRLGFEEAQTHVRQALELLPRMRPGPEVKRRELAAQVQLGGLLFMTKGYSEAEVGRAWSRARQLCHEVPDAPELLPTLWGLWAYTCVRAEFADALDLARELLEHAQKRTGVEATLFGVIGHETMGITCWHQGRLSEARDHLELGARLCDTLPPEMFSGVLLEKHPGVACRSFASNVLWLLGDRSGAIEKAEEGVALARRLDHPFSVVVALFFDAWLRVLLEDRDAVVARADEAIALARRHGFGQFEAMLEILRGWARNDVAEIERAFQEFLATGSRMLQHFFLGLAADVQCRLRRTEDALATVERALAASVQVGERFWVAELHRLRAELLGTAPGAEESLDRALAAARLQGARALEARVGASLAHR